MITFYFRGFQKPLGLHQRGSVFRELKKKNTTTFTIYYITKACSLLTKWEAKGWSRAAGRCCGTGCSCRRALQTDPTPHTSSEDLYVKKYRYASDSLWHLTPVKLKTKSLVWVHFLSTVSFLFVNSLLIFISLWAVVMFGCNPGIWALMVELFVFYCRVWQLCLHIPVYFCNSAFQSLVCLLRCNIEIYKGVESVP